MTNGNTDGYAGQSRRFLVQAYEELSKEDLRQASEKGWGATAQAIKAVANSRSAEHKGHGHLISVAQALAVELDEDDVRQRFNAGAELHTNFYEGLYNHAEIEGRLERVSLLVERIETLLNGHYTDGREE